MLVLKKNFRYKTSSTCTDYIKLIMILIVSYDDFLVWPFHLLKIVVFETPSASKFLLTYLGVGVNNYFVESH